MGQDERLDELDRRLSRIEGFLSRRGFRPGEAMPPPLPRAVEPAGPIPVAEVSGGEHSGEVPPAALAQPVASAVAPSVAPALESVVAPPPSPFDVKTIAYEQMRTSSPVADASANPPGAANVEQVIGLKVAGWIGAIVLVIGAALGVKFAYDQGWLGQMPNELRLGLLYALGFAIIGAGEWVYRRVDPRAAVGLYAAGIACLFVVGYAGSVYFKLYTPATAFFLMAAACFVGAAISLRGGLVSIGVLSLLGANLAPLILRDQSVGEIPLLVYLLTLQVMAVGLAYMGGLKSRWWILRSLALVLTSLWVMGRLIAPATAHSMPTILFAAIYFVVFQLENMLAARRAGERTQEPAAFSFPTFSLAATAAFTIQVLFWTSIYSSMQRAGVLVGMGMVASVLAAMFTQSGVARNPALRSLGVGWIVQASLLAFIAVPVALSGPWLTIGWAGLGLAYVVLGALVGRRWTMVWGTVVWFVALGQFVLAAGTLRSMKGVWMQVGDVTVTAALGIGLILGLVGHAIALVLSGKPVAAPADVPRFVPNVGLRDLGGVTATVATFLMGTLCVVYLPGLVATGAMIVLAWMTAGVAIAFAGRRDLYAALAIGLAGVTTAKWAAMDVVGPRTLPEWDAAARTPFLNPVVALGLAAAVTLIVLTRWIGRRRPVLEGNGLSATRAVLLTAMGVMTIGLSFEVERVAVLHAPATPWSAAQLLQFGLTALWTIAVLLHLSIGRVLDRAPESNRLGRRIVAACVGLIAAKFVILDSIGMALAAPRVTNAAALFNLHTFTGLVVLVGIGIALRGCADAALRLALYVVAFFVPLVTVSLELDRLVGPDRTQVAWSVFWGIYAIASIVTGFAIRSAACRFAGLGLLGVTLLKIVLVDLASAGAGWRILSFLGVGAILLATSVLYGKLSPRLLGNADERK